MKLKWFVVFVTAFVIAGIAALVATCKNNAPPPKPVVATPTPDPTPAPAPTPTPTPVDTNPAPSGSSDLAARAWDADVLSWRTRSISSDKQKDVSKGKSYKINVYKDAGSSTVNRAKVDVNRNDKWDEKYTFDGEKITLQRAPNDDEHYSETYHWNGSGWTKE
jgi:hypothetical protein